MRFLATAAAAMALAALTRWPVGSDPEHALVRLSWKTAGARVEVQRELTPEEKERIPLHMQAPGGLRELYVLPYHLCLTADGRVLVERSVDPAGVHGDRPLVVGQDVPLAPGLHRLQMEFRPAPTPDQEKIPDVARALEIAPTYAWEGEVQLEAGRVLLVTLEGDRVRVVR